MKILLTGAFNYSKEQLKRIESLGFEITYVKDEREKVNIDVSNIDGVICNSLFLYNDIRRFEKLKFIHLTSSGLDRIPINYIQEKKIILFNAKDVYSIPMAEWVVLKILEIYKKSKMFYENQKEHKWEKHRDLLELTNKIVSIIGFGSVGKEVAKRLKPFGVHIIGVGRRKIESELTDEFYMINQLDYALKKSDIAILTLPLTSDTYHLINKQKINNMKDDSILINVSRGSIIDENELITALKSGKFLGVALDVFEEEPLCEDSALWDMKNVLISPHNSFVSEGNNSRFFNLLINNLQKFLINVKQTC